MVQTGCCAENVGSKLRLEVMVTICSALYCLSVSVFVGNERQGSRGEETKPDEYRVG